MTNIQLPPQFEIDHRIDSNPVLRLRRPPFSGEAEVSGYTNGRVRGLLVTHPDRVRTIVVPRAIEPALSSDEVLVSRNVDAVRGSHSSWAPFAKWTKPAPLPVDSLTASVLRAKCNEARASWIDAVSFREESAAATGLRRAQVGALHATLAHWTVSDAPATVVMPTGTGKTEVMVALLAAT